MMEKIIKLPVLITPRFTLDIEVLKKTVKNAVIFLSPVIIAALLELAKLLPENIPPQYVALSLWVVNVLIDLVRKYVSENKTVIENPK